MTFPDGQTDSSDDKIIIKELNVEKGSAIESEVNEHGVKSGGRQDGGKGDKDEAEIDFQEPSGKLSMGAGSGVRSNNDNGTDGNETVGRGNAVDKSVRKRCGREKTGSREPSLVNADVQYQRDIARAQAISREETPGCLPAEQVIQLGIRAAARLGILCRRPNLPLVRNSFIPMDGNCIQSCCCHATIPHSRERV